MADSDVTAEQPALSAREPSGGFDLRGQTIGEYKILSKLGEGGFGEVYLAEQVTPVQRRVALKVIKPGMDSRSVLARFEAERQALALMDHPSVAKVFDAGITPNGRPFFAMEFVRGQPITRYCEHERLSVDERVDLMIQTCSAVQHAHMKGVLHRDLKPTNILVEAADRQPLVKIIDFGVAKALNQRLSASTIVTEQGQMIGTPEYVAPEQARGSVDVDTRADVYALGAVLYELLTGVTPFDLSVLRAEGFAGLQRALEDIMPPPPSARLSDLLKAGVPSSHRVFDTPTLIKRVRGDLDWIVMKCLEKERARRYDSAAALADDLERYLRDEPVLAGPPSATYRAVKFVRRHRFGVAASLLILLSLVAAVIGTGYGLALAVDEREHAQQQAIAAERARDESEAVTQFLTSMIESVQPDEVGRDVTVRDALDAAADRLGEDFRDRPLVEARLRHALGVSYWQLGRHDDADRHLPRVVETRRTLLGPDHHDTLTAMSNLASLRMAQGRDREAGELLSAVVDGFTRTVGDDHALTLGALNNLAVLRGRQGLDDQTLALHRRVVEGQRRANGPAHPHTLGAMLNLADALTEMDRLDEAEPLLRDAVARWERAHGPDKSGTLLALHNLAMLELRRNRPAEAESLMRRVVAGRERVLGREHNETLSALANLGTILHQNNKTIEAEAAFTSAWQGLRKVLGDTHTTTLIVNNQLVGVISAQSWPPRSRETVVALIESARQAVQRSDVSANELNNLAYLFMQAQPAELRDHQAALMLAARACEAERARNGASLWMYLDTLASAQFHAGAPADAQASQREAIGLIPPAGEQYRGEMEQRLRDYELATAPP
jgi:serine/threonine protein kinase